MIDIREMLKQGPILLDGATGTNLFAAGMPGGVCPELWLCDNENVILELQKAYQSVGSQILYAPTFSANPIKLAEYGAGDRVNEVNRTLAGLSKRAAQGRCYVAGDLTMTGASLKPVGQMYFETLVDCYKTQVRSLLSADVDLFVIETMMSLAETRAAVLAVKECCDLPVFVTMSFDEGGRTLYGTDPVTALVTMQSLGVDAFGLNCSCGPKEMVDWVRDMKHYAKVPLIVKPNAGLPKLIDGNSVFDMDSETFAEAMMELIEAGASIVGGCCGTTPVYIRRLKEKIQEKFIENGRWESLYQQIYAQPKEEYRRVLTSERGRLALTLDGGFTVVGERINPTGKKALQAALREHDLEMVKEFAESQAQLGAGILDINVGMSGIDEKSVMIDVIQMVTELVSTPLCIDSSDPDVLEAALRIYPGRALVNSVSRENNKIEQLMPIVRKYGAMFILLPMSDEGIPETVQQRLEHIQYVMKEALKLGFSREDIVVDGLVGAVGALKKAGRDTLDTIEWCYQHGLATVCGLSNISFGLPDRSYVNSVFLALAISRGLTMAIANPSQELLMRCGYAADLLMAKDDAGLRYIQNSQLYEGKKGQTGDENKDSMKHPEQKDGIVQHETMEEILEEIHRDVLKGHGKKVTGHVENALKQGIEASDILNRVLIPAINLVGEYFAQQKYFLPQLMLSAETMRRAVDILEPELLKKQTGPAGPAVIIATVKGDVHDIGKNLVAMMMRNYGFRVYDLGKDVDKESIVQAAVTYNAEIICLSALMTTTMQYMKEVIDLVKVKSLKAKVIIGGAAVTREFAEEIGADGYSADAVDAVMLVKRLLNLS